MASSASFNSESVELHRIDGTSTDHVGKLTLDVRAPRKHPKATTPLAAALLEPIWRRYGEELARRHAEVRAAVQRTSVATLVSGQAPVVTPSRSGPCPCGSGKKYKRCCAGATKGRGEPA